MAKPLGVRMSWSMMMRTLAPDRVARMMLGCCSFQLVQNIRLGGEEHTEPLEPQLSLIQAGSAHPFMAGEASRDWGMDGTSFPCEKSGKGVNEAAAGSWEMWGSGAALGL